MPVLAHDVVSTSIALVVPTVRLLGKDAGSADAVQIHPLIVAAIQADWEIFQTLLIDVPNQLLSKFVRIRHLAVFKLQRWQRFLEVPVGVGLVRLAYVA